MMSIVSSMAQLSEQWSTITFRMPREQKYLDAVAASVDFSLGMHPSEMSWMTGAGTVYPMDPCNLNCLDDGVEEPHPGILIYGPTGYWYDNQCVLYPDKSKMGFLEGVGCRRTIGLGRCSHAVCFRKQRQVWAKIRQCC